MKKGISLIVLVITIIVMIIIAGAIIISLNSSNVITKADDAVLKSDLANVRSELTLKYTEIILDNNEKDNDAASANTTKMSVEAAQGLYKGILAKYDKLTAAGYTVTAASDYTYVLKDSTGATVQ